MSVHVSASVIGFGVTFSYPVIQLLAERRDPRALPFAMASILAISRWIAVPATTIVGATGIYQVAAGPYSTGDAWVVLGLVLYIATMGVGILYLAPAYATAKSEARRMVDEASEDGPVRISDDYRAAVRRPRLVGPWLAATIVVIVALMEVKPG